MLGPSTPPASTARKAGGSRTWRVALLAMTMAGAAGLQAGPATAHGDAGRMTVTVAEQSGDDELRVEVDIVYANDDDPATDADVEATLTGHDGTVVGPTPLPNLDGARYGAEVDVPDDGVWDIEVTSTEPAALATAAVAVVPVESTTTTSEATTTSTAEASDEQDLADQAPGGTAEPGVSPIVVVAGVLAIVVVVAAALVPVVSRRRRGG